MGEEKEKYGVLFGETPEEDEEDSTQLRNGAISDTVHGTTKLIDFGAY